MPVRLCFYTRCWYWIWEHTTTPAMKLDILTYLHYSHCHVGTRSLKKQQRWKRRSAEMHSQSTKTGQKLCNQKDWLHAAGLNLPTAGDILCSSLPKLWLRCHRKPNLTLVKTQNQITLVQCLLLCVLLDPAVPWLRQAWRRTSTMRNVTCHPYWWLVTKLRDKRAPGSLLLMLLSCPTVYVASPVHSPGCCSLLCSHAAVGHDSYLTACIPANT